MSHEQDRLADAGETSGTDLIGELKGVRDSVEQLYILLDHIWRNREELHDVMAELLEDRSEQCREDETVACCRCNALQSSLATAVRQGWANFQYDRGDDWMYLAVCRECQEKQADGGRQRATLGAEMGLTPAQVQQAVVECISTAAGLRRIEKDARGDEVREIIACARCDVDSPESLAAALQEGWIELCRDDGEGWNYLGICPQCQAEEFGTVGPKTPATDEQKRLFT
jgi:hypothetical protein